MTRSPFQRAVADERGATLFIVAVAMFALLVSEAIGRVVGRRIGVES